jgi:uncharacterized protein YciI
MHSDDRRDFIARTLIATASLGTPALVEAQGVDSERREPSDPTWLVVYGLGPNWLEGKPLAQQQLRPHGAYMLQLYRAGALRWAGGFADDSGGAAAFTAHDAVTAQKIVEEDPAVVSGIFKFVLRPWKLVDWAAVDKRATQAR